MLWMQLAFICIYGVVSGIGRLEEE